MAERARVFDFANVCFDTKLSSSVSKVVDYLVKKSETALPKLM